MAELDDRLAVIIEDLQGIRWFENAGTPDARAKVAAGLAEAWDGYWNEWNARSESYWLEQSRRLETEAVRMLGAGGLDAVFETVARELGETTWAALGAYLERHPDDSGVSDGIAIDLHDAVKRDAAWIAIEILVDRLGVFRDALGWYRRGRRLFGWIDGLPPNSRSVIL
jgi:hypothetical protein